MPEPIDLTTADPRFDPKRPVRVNGYAFAPARRKTFFIVFSPEGEAPPKVIHPTHNSAMREAHRLAALHPGHRFRVMESASYAISSDAPATVEMETERG